MNARPHLGRCIAGGRQSPRNREASPLKRPNGTARRAVTSVERGPVGHDREGRHHDDKGGQRHHDDGRVRTGRRRGSGPDRRSDDRRDRKGRTSRCEDYRSRTMPSQWGDGPVGIGAVEIQFWRRRSKQSFGEEDQNNRAGAGTVDERQRLEAWTLK